MRRKCLKALYFLFLYNKFENTMQKIFLAHFMKNTVYITLVKCKPAVRLC